MRARVGLLCLAAVGPVFVVGCSRSTPPAAAAGAIAAPAAKAVEQPEVEVAPRLTDAIDTLGDAPSVVADLASQNEEGQLRALGILAWLGEALAIAQDGSESGELTAANLEGALVEASGSLPLLLRA